MMSQGLTDKPYLDLEPCADVHMHVLHTQCTDLSLCDSGLRVEQEMTTFYIALCGVASIINVCVDSSPCMQVLCKGLWTRPMCGV